MTGPALARETEREVQSPHRREPSPHVEQSEETAQDRLGAQGAFEAELAAQDDGWTGLALAVERMLNLRTGSQSSAFDPDTNHHETESETAAYGGLPVELPSLNREEEETQPTAQTEDEPYERAVPVNEAERPEVEVPRSAVTEEAEVAETEVDEAPESTRSRQAVAMQAAPMEAPTGRSAQTIARRWSGQVRQRAQAIPAPEISPEQQQQAALLAIGAAGRERSEDVQQTAQREALSQVSEAPQQEEPLPAPPPNNPVPEHTQRITDLSDKRLPDQPARRLNRSQVFVVEDTEIGGSLPRLHDVPVASDLFNVLTSAPDLREIAGEPVTNREQRQVEAAMRTLTTTEEDASRLAEALAGMGRAPAVIEPDTGPRPAPPLPEAERAPVGQVVARLLAQEEETVAGVLDNLRTLAFPGGILKAKFPDIGSGMASDLQSSVRSDLQDVAAAANISAEDLNQAVAERKQELAQQGQEATEEVNTLRTEAIEETRDSGQTALDAVQGAANAASEETLRRQEQATGGVDADVINRRRDRTVSWIRTRVTEEITAYQQAGDRRLSQLRRAKTEQTNGYNALAQREVYQVLRPSGERPERDPNDRDRETMLARFATDIRAGARTQTTAVANHFDRDIRISRETTQTYRREIESAGSVGIEATRQWAEDKILEGESWWTRFVARVTRWMEEAEDVNEQWRVRKTTELRDNVNRDLAVADRIGEALATGVSRDQILASQAISEDQRFVIGQFFALGEGAHPLEYAALSIKFQLAQSHRPHARQVFERELIATPISGAEDPVIDDLVAVTASEGGSFDPRAITEGVRAAMRGWGTDEARIYRSLANLSALQGNIVRKVYRARYNSDLDSDLDSELSGDELDRAQQLLAGEQARADAAALHYAIAGLGTDEAAIMATLRSKSPEEIAAIRAAYLEQYGETLDAALEGDLADGHEIDQANALLNSNNALADAIAVDQAMRGGMFGWGASASEVEAVQNRIRQEAQALAEQNDWSAEQLEQEVQRRLREVEGHFEDQYGDVEEYNTPGLEGSTAMRRAFNTEFYGAERDLVVALQDNNLAAADAARIEIERTGFYASDDRINTVLQSQYERSLVAARLDQGPSRRAYAEREFHRRVEALQPPESTDPVVHSRIRMELQRDMEAAIESEAVARSRVSMDELEQVYNGEYIWPLSFVVDWNTSGDANARAVALFESGGRMDPLQEIEIASAAGDGSAALSRLSTMTKADIDRIAADWERRHPGRSFEDLLRSSFSGRDQSDILDTFEHGRPTDALETIDQERRRVRRELGDLTGTFGHAAASDEAAWMRAELSRLEALESQLRTPVPDTEEGRAQSLGILDEVDRRANYVRAAVDDHRHQIDSVTNVVSQAIGVAIAIVVAVVVTALTLGTGAGAGVAIAAAIIGSVLATGATMATKQLIKGGAYGRDEMTTDLIVGAVDLVVSVATLGIGSRILGPIMRGASGAAGLVRAAASGTGRLIGNAGSRLAATGAGRAVASGASRLAGSGFGQAARGGISALGRGISGAGRGLARAGQRMRGGLADIGSGIAERGRGAMSAIGRRASPRAREFGAGMRELARETIDQVPTSREALQAAARNTLEQGIEDAVAAVPSAMTGMALSDQAWKGDPLENFAAGAWDAILQGVVMGRVMGSAIHMATPAIRRGRLPFLNNISKVGEVSSYLNARFAPFAQRNPGASMADFLRSDQGRATMAEVQRRGLMDALVDLSRAGPTRADVDADGATSVQGREHADILADTVPQNMRDGTFVTADPNLPGRSVEVQPLRVDGRIVGVDIRVGAEATPLDIALHLPTVRTMRRYRGLLGEVRATMDRMAIALTGQGQQIGREGWAAQAEIEKLPAVIASRMDELASGRLTPEAEARIQREIDGLHAQLRGHRAIVNDSMLSNLEGDDVVAARDESRAGRSADRRNAADQELRALDEDFVQSAQRGAFTRNEQKMLELIDNRASRRVVESQQITPEQRIAQVRELFADQPQKLALWFRMEAARVYISQVRSALRARADLRAEPSPQALAQLAELRRMLTDIVADETFGVHALVELLRINSFDELPGLAARSRPISSRKSPVEHVLDGPSTRLSEVEARRQQRHEGLVEAIQNLLPMMGNFQPTHAEGQGSRIDDRIPDRPGGGATHGVVDSPNGPLFFVSSETGPGSTYIDSSTGAPASNYSGSHVEGHVAALMREHGIAHLTVTINNRDGPCGTCLGASDSSVGNILPVGSSLTVRYMDEGGHIRTRVIQGLAQ